MNLPGNFEDIRPFNDLETHEALQRIIKYPQFFRVISYFYPDITKEAIHEQINNIRTISDWQVTVMQPIINSIINKTIDRLTWSGIEKLTPGQNYLYISNHRDILLDSAILQVLLYNNGFETSQIAFGNNLMENDFIRDIGKINKMFAVVRDCGGKEFYKNSSYLSSYIRYIISEKKSVWIAQRNGRTKDGNDKTHTAVLKMLNISGNEDILSNFRNLNIIPVAVSYEYEPCDFYKIRELYFSQKNEYKKRPGEDIDSIVNGVIQKKGRMHIAIAGNINDKLEKLNKTGNENEKFKEIAVLIDNEIYSNYKLWPTNYIAAGLLGNNLKYSEHYDKKQSDFFKSYIEKLVNKIDGDPVKIKNMFLRLYANPVFNFAGRLKNIN